MGLALDEPREGDERYQVEDVPLIMDPFAHKLAEDFGGVNITNSMFGPTVELSNASGGCS